METAMTRVDLGYENSEHLSAILRNFQEFVLLT